MAKSLVEKHDTTARKPDNLDLTLIQHWEKLEQSFSSPDLIEEWGRLRVWGGNVGIISSRKNLEHGLHDSPHLRGVVNELMDSLWSIVEQHTSVTQKASQQQPLDDEDYDCLAEWRNDVDEGIEDLYELIPDLLDPAPHRRVIDDEWLASASKFQVDFDVRHAQDKYPNASPYLQQRLGHANWLRRALRGYAETTNRSAADPHYGESEVNRAQSVISKPSIFRDSALGESIYTSSEHDRGGDASGTLAALVQAVIPPSLSQQALLHIPVEIEEFDDCDSLASATSYAGTITAGEESDGVRSIPRPPEPFYRDEDFQCPYCMVELKGLKSINAWKRHIFSDLKPYMCTSEPCIYQHRPFSRRREWADHEKLHRVQWECNDPACATTFPLLELFEDHVAQQHPDAHSPTQLASISRMCQRMQDSPTTCPLCDMQLEDNLAFEKHLAGELEHFALFVLPRSNGWDDDADSDDNNSDGSSEGSLTKTHDPFSARMVDGLQSNHLPDMQNIESQSSKAAQADHGIARQAELLVLFGSSNDSSYDARPNGVTLERAYEYIDKLSDRALSDPQKFVDLKLVLEDWGGSRLIGGGVDSVDVVRRFCDIYSQHQDLLSDFNDFLPPGFVIVTDDTKENYSFHHSSITASGRKWILLSNSCTHRVPSPSLPELIPFREDWTTDINYMPAEATEQQSSSPVKFTSTSNGNDDETESPIEPASEARKHSDSDRTVTSPTNEIEQHTDRTTASRVCSDCEQRGRDTAECTTCGARGCIATSKTHCENPCPASMSDTRAQREYGSLQEHPESSGQHPSDLPQPPQSLLSDRLNAAYHERPLSLASGANSNSPFTKGSPFDPEGGWKDISPFTAEDESGHAELRTAAAVRQQDKAQADAVAYAQHHSRGLPLQETLTVIPEDTVALSPADLASQSKACYPDGSCY